MIVAKGKKRRTEVEEDRELEKNATIRTKRTEKQPVVKVRGGEIQAVVSETLSRCYGEMFPSFTVRDENDEPTVEIKEDAYILTLVMMVGHDDYSPRTGLPITEKEISDNARYCKEHTT